uniref:Sulfotransferase domain-containing protein n=1 Tax=Eubacterium plexicaudatum ASF492 TaxID=1235802 RepID=N2ABI3_9FIRM
MKKILYVHVGTTKTGTTAIQSFLIDNQEVLNRKGYCYPLFPYRYQEVSERRNARFLLEEASDRQNGIFREGMDRIHELFRTFDNIIVSDEGIWSANYEQRITMWRALKAEAKEGGFQIKIIVYLRRQDMYLISGWNQMVKSGLGADAGTAWSDYVHNLNDINKMKYATHLKKIAAFFGKKNLIVRRFEPKRFVNGTIYADFLQTVRLELTDEFRIEQAAKNIRLAGNTHEIQRVLNGMPGMNPAFHSFFRQSLLSYADLSGETYPCEMFSKEEAEAFMQQYEEENREVAREYFNEEELFDMIWKDAPKWEKDNPQMQDDLIRFVGACCMRLAEENRDLKSRVEWLEKSREGLRHPVYTLLKRRRDKKNAQQ